MKNLVVKGARQHNLQNISVTLLLPPDFSSVRIGVNCLSGFGMRQNVRCKGKMYLGVRRNGLMVSDAGFQDFFSAPYAGFGNVCRRFAAWVFSDSLFARVMDGAVFFAEAASGTFLVWCGCLQFAFCLIWKMVFQCASDLIW